MPCLICSLAALSVTKTRPLLRRNPARWVSSSRKVMVLTPGPLTQSGGRNGEIHHDIRSHGELRRVFGRASKAGGKDPRLANERNVADDVSLELGIDAVR